MFLPCEMVYECLREQGEEVLVVELVVDVVGQDGFNVGVRISELK